MITTCDMGHCLKCNGLTSSGASKYCTGCSSVFQICAYCGSK
jgi:hypothetical protein